MAFAQVIVQAALTPSLPGVEVVAVLDFLEEETGEFQDPDATFPILCLRGTLHRVDEGIRPGGRDV